MKRGYRVLISMLLMLSVMLSCVTFAEGSYAEAEAEASEVQSTESLLEGMTEEEQNAIVAEAVKSIATNLEIFARYDEVDKASLYEAAIEKLITDNPKLYETVVRAMLESIDENSFYYNAEESKALFEALSDEITGIGVNVLSTEGKILVSQPIPDSPAEKAGIRAGDVIIGADGVDLRGMDFDAALEYVRGKVGTTVRIEILRTGISEPIIFDIVREKVVSNPIDFEIIEKDETQIAKITIYSFTENVLEHFKEALSKADSEGITNLILDLRNNGGGYFDGAIGIADLLLTKKDAVITTEEHKLDILNRTYKATGKGKKYDIAVLINGISASSSEVLTAALRENDAAVVIGERSFGKGTVQTLAEAPGGGVMKYTTAYYLTPKGNNIHKMGITPDATVVNSTKPVDMTQFGVFSLQTTYRLGDTGEEVRFAKEMLKHFGIFVGDINDIYDENLKLAVTTYQSIQGLYPYGVLDMTTQFNLYETLRNSEEEVDDQLQAAIDHF